MRLHQCQLVSVDELPLLPLLKRANFSENGIRSAARVLEQPKLIESALRCTFSVTRTFSVCTGVGEDGCYGRPHMDNHNRIGVES
jgi:hypothetical protein